MRLTFPRRRTLLIGAAVLTSVGVVAAAGMLWWKPWAPRVEVVDPGPSGTRIDAAGVVGNYYPAEADPAPGILVLGGSEGGISAGADAVARALHAEGFSALALHYFGDPGGTTRMSEIPLETFDRGIDWLADQPQVLPDRLGVVGGSKGGEAAVLLGSRRPDLRAVVGLTPSHVVWQGFDLGSPWQSVGSTWSSDGVGLPYLPNGRYSPGGDLVDMYRDGLAALSDHPDAVIPVERSTAPYLLVCGEADILWPACEMSQQVAQRAAARGGPPVTVLSYPDSGHLGVGPPVPIDDPFHKHLADVGGTVEGNAAARADSWPQIVAFLRQHLAAG